MERWYGTQRWVEGVMSELDKAITWARAQSCGTNAGRYATILAEEIRRLGCEVDRLREDRRRIDENTDRNNYRPEMDEVD